MSSGSIQIKRKDRNDGAGSTFDGIKFTFSPNIKVPSRSNDQLVAVLIPPEKPILLFIPNEELKSPPGNCIA